MRPRCWRTPVRRRRPPPPCRIPPGCFDKRRSMRIGDEGRDDVRGAGDDADQKAEHRAAPDRHRPTPRAPRARAAIRAASGFCTAGRAPCAAVSRISETPNKPDRDRHDADAVAELDHAVAEAHEAAHRVDADHAEEQPEHRHRQRLEHRAAGHVGQHQQPEQQQRRVFRRAELQRDARERRREQHEPDHAERAGDERSDGGDRKRRAGAALAASSRSRRCRSSPKPPRRGCASGSRSSTRRTSRRSTCRPAAPSRSSASARTSPAAAG